MLAEVVKLNPCSLQAIGPEEDHVVPLSPQAGRQARATCLATHHPIIGDASGTS